MMAFSLFSFCVLKFLSPDADSSFSFTHVRLLGNPNSILYCAKYRVLTTVVVLLVDGEWCSNLVLLQYFFLVGGDIFQVRERG